MKSETRPIVNRAAILRSKKLFANIIYAIGMLVVFGLGIGVGYVIRGRSADATTVTDTVDLTNTKRYDVPAGNNPSIGPSDAPITLIEFSDYQCPYCRQWYNQVYHRLLSEYPDKIRFVYRDFPLSSIHAQAEPAAEAAYCAQEQGAYWQFHDALFSMKYGLDDAAFTKYATDLGLKVDVFAQCLSEHRYQKNVLDNYDFAVSLGVQSTPTFFINGIALVGAQPYEVFKQVIDQELAGKISK